LAAVKGPLRAHPSNPRYFADGSDRAVYLTGSHQLFAGPADWISPSNDGRVFRYHDEPPAADGRKVILSDTDHFFGVGGDQKWVWKSFTRGLNPIFMDPLHVPYDATTPPREGDDQPPGMDSRWEPARRAMGYTRRYAERINLAAMEPRADLASSEYCLAHPESDYLVYLPDGGDVEVDLTAAQGPVAIEWMHPIDGNISPGETIMGGAQRALTAPFAGDAVLYISAPAP
jgi:hypothetical protein